MFWPKLQVAGRTALMYASGAGHASCVQQLLSLGADRQMCDAEGNTAAMLARKAGHNPVVVILEGNVA